MSRLPGVTGATLNAMTGTLTVEGEGSLDAIRREARIEGYAVTPGEGAAAGLDATGTVSAVGEGAPGVPASGARRALRHAHANREVQRLAIAVIAVAVGYAAMPAGVPEWFAIAAFVVAAAVGGYGNFRKALRSIPRLDLNMSVLMTVAVIGAFAIGEYSEAGVVAALFALSEMLEAWTMDRARRSIRELLDIAPKTARLETAAGIADVLVGAVRPGDVMLVRPGEKVALDGVVLSGASAVSEAAITGESVPVEKAAGSDVYAGTYNENGALRVEVTRLAEDTTLARIIHLVEEAQVKRAPSQAFVDRFAAVYTPIVLALAGVFMLVPPLFFSAPWHDWIYRGLALLVVSCPCALVVSTPVAIVSAISSAARRGVLVKGGVHLEQMGSVRAIAFDKTGTLTMGRPSVTEVVPLADISADDLLAEAAAVEWHSEHPLARAVVAEAAARSVAVPASSDFRATFGRGAEAVVGGRLLRIGGPGRFEADVEAPAVSGTSAPEDAPAWLSRARTLEAAGRTVLVLSEGELALGLIALADEIRPEAAAAVQALRVAGIEHVVMLTGDNPRAAAAIASAVGADRFEAGLLPEQKVAAVEALLAEYGTVAMVGDGVNDAPALATATIGIAMGGAGSDTALETADIALMADDLQHLPFTVRLSRAALGTIHANIAFALGIKLLAVLAVFPGWLTLWLAIVADMGASVLVTLNGARLLRVRE